MIRVIFCQIVNGCWESHLITSSIQQTGNMALENYFSSLAMETGTTNFLLCNDHASSSTQYRMQEFRIQRTNSCSRTRTRSPADKFSSRECSQPPALPPRRDSEHRLNEELRSHGFEQSIDIVSMKHPLSSRTQRILLRDVYSNSSKHHLMRRMMKDNKPPSCPMRKSSKTDLAH